MLNQKKINSFFLLLVLVLPVFISPNAYAVDGEIEEILESKNNIPAPDSISNDVDSSTPATKSTIDYDKFYLSESVKTQIEFNKQPIDYTHIKYEVWPSIGDFSTGTRFVTYDVYNGLADDDNIIHFEMYSDVLNEPVADHEGFELETRIYCGGAGTLNYDFRGLWYSNTPSYPTSSYTIWKKDTFDITSTMLDSLGYIYLLFRLEMYNNGDYVAARLYYFTDSGITQITAGVLTSVTSVDFIAGALKVDYLYFVRDKITNTIRSEQKYASSTTMINKKIIPSVPHAKEITVNLMTDETVTSVNPSASWSVSSNVLTISSPVELNYEVLTSRTCSNFLAITEVSTSFLTDVGFEGGTKNDLSNVITSPFDSFTISTNIVSEGYYSLKGVDTEGTTDVFNFNIDYRGKVYCSFDYYLLTGYTWSDFKVYWRISDSTWDYETVTFGSSERWNKVFLGFDLLGWESANNRNFVLQFGSGQGTVYIDNLRFFIPSTTIETLEPSKYLSISALHAWDGYKNPLLEGQQILNTTLLERSSQTVEYTTNLTSTTGIFELEYNQGLEQKEYEIWTYSYSSGEFNNCSFYFTPSYAHQTDYVETELNDAWDFSEGDLEGMSIHSNYDIVSSSISTENGKFIIEYESAGTATSYVMTKITNLSPSIDLSYYDSFTIRAKSNSSATTHVFYLYHTTYSLLTTADSVVEFSDSWEVIQTDVLQDLDLSELYFVCRQKTISANSFKIEIDFSKIIHIDSFLETTNDYATDELLDAWDWEETDKEGWTYAAECTSSVSDGSFVIDDSGTAAYFGVGDTAGLSIDTTLYTHVIITYQWFHDVVEGTENLQFKTTTGTIGDVIYITDEKIHTDIVLLSGDSDWTGTVSDFRVFAQGNGVDNDQLIIYDIKLIHQEELSYTTIQNSVLLESETNDLQYNLYLDWNFIGTFPDLSLIPLVQTVGTHYLQVQPFRTDQAYITQNVYSYYYTIEADSFSVSVGSFYLSDTYVNTYVSSNYDYNYYIYEDNDPAGSGSGYKEGTTVSSNRDTTAGATISYAIKFVYSSEIVWFNTTYSNSRTAFYVESYKIDIQEENIQIIWSTTKSDVDSLTVYEGTVLKVDAEEDSPSSWVKSTVVGVHYVTLIFEAVTYGSIIYSFNYEVFLEVFQVNIEDYHVGDLFIETHVTSSENGNYQAYENNTIEGSQGTLLASGTSIQSDRNNTEDALIYYAIKFWNAAEETIWFNTTYSNVEGEFFVIEYSVDIGEITITITWSTSLPDSDSLTVKEDGANEVTDDETSPSDWPKSTIVGTHSVVLLFESDGYPPITYSFNYHIYAVEDFIVDIGSFQVSDTNVSTYATSNYDGNYYVYEDNDLKNSGLFYGAGTNIETGKDTTAGATIFYAIKFVYESTTIWFNTSYSNPRTPFYLTDYRVTDGSTITITWDSTLPALDSLTIYEDGVLIEDADPSSTTSWVKSTEVGNHYVTLIFSATDYTDIIHSFSYIVYPPTAFSIDIDTFYVTDDYVNMYLTANFDYSYTVYENGTEIGTGNGMAVGTTIISPKNKEAGLYNFTIIFTYNSETIPFMTWYSNLIPPNHPLNDLWRMESQGFYNISLHSNLDSYWIDIYHDDSLIIDDSIASYFSIEKGLRVGWHNITVHYIYNCSTNAEGYPVAEYNITLVYEFWYETTFFYDVRIRYIPDNLGLAIGEFNVNSVKTYMDGELVLHGDIDDVVEYSNYSFITNYEIRIKNTAPTHSLVVKDLLDRTILTRTIDISSFTQKIITLPIYRLGVINWDNETHKFGVQALSDIDKPWKLSPELPQGVFIEFWFCDVIYLFRIYSANEYIDEDGITYKLWDEWVDLPPGRLPRIFEIPLSYDGEDDDPDPPGWWTTPAFIGGMSLAGFIIILIALIVIYRLIKKRGVFIKT